LNLRSLSSINLKLGSLLFIRFWLGFWLHCWHNSWLEGWHNPCLSSRIKASLNCWLFFFDDLILVLFNDLEWISNIYFWPNGLALILFLLRLLFLLWLLFLFYDLIVVFDLHLILYVSRLLMSMRVIKNHLYITQILLKLILFKNLHRFFFAIHDNFIAWILKCKIDQHLHNLWFHYLSLFIIMNCYDIFII